MELKNIKMPVIGGLLILIFCLQYSAIIYAPLYHDSIRYLYVIPVIAGGYFFYLRGGIILGILSALSSSVHIFLHGNIIYADLILQMLIFCIIGGVTGFLAGNDKKKQKMLELSSMSFLKSLSNALDARDTYTQGHSIRVAEIAAEIGKELGLSVVKTDLLYQAGLVHDIGKIGIPDSILKKEGKLDDDEYRMIRKHPEIGEIILQEIGQFKPFISGVKYHHEKYDGTGYPDRLAGKNIPLYGRIIAVADAYDAMTSVRTYNSRKKPVSAVVEIDRYSGTQFDPDILKAFFKIFPKITEIREEKEVIDPICLMKINPSKASVSVMYKNQMYYFCSSACKNIFFSFPGKL